MKMALSGVGTEVRVSEVSDIRHELIFRQGKEAKPSIATAISGFLMMKICRKRSYQCISILEMLH